MSAALSLEGLPIVVARQLVVLARSVLGVLGRVVRAALGHSFLGVALLNKLEQRWNVPVPILCLLKSYLSDRTQSVRVEGKLSEAVSIESGVPQGSVVGGLLFCA